MVGQTARQPSSAGRFWPPAGAAVGGSDPRWRSIWATGIPRRPTCFLQTHRATPCFSTRTLSTCPIARRTSMRGSGAVRWRSMALRARSLPAGTWSRPRWITPCMPWAWPRREGRWCSSAASLAVEQACSETSISFPSASCKPTRLRRARSSACRSEVSLSTSNPTLAPIAACPRWTFRRKALGKRTSSTRQPSTMAVLRRCARSALCTGARSPASPCRT
mmetsp:Transcript_38178/g.105246  ORF Transcript_38178/g.105246 Transcript_38178/m.105246 type:complete len:220 (+) Transcript_38178:332-991(+)